MQLKFTKMQGLGNDFVVIDTVRQPVAMTAELAQRLGDRHFGIGCDQILLVGLPAHPGNDFSYRILNADGSEVEQCGNGARCFVRFVHDQALSPKTALRVETAGGVIEPRLEANGDVTVNMGVPRFDPGALPFLADQEALTYHLALDGHEVEISAVSMGNPHAVQVVADVNAAPVAHDGPQIEHHVRFPNRVNAGYMQLLSRQEIRLRVHERGAGETLACGTGACAAVVSGIRRGLLEHEVKVQTRGGALTVRWDGPGQPVWMTGPAVTVFEGSITI